MSDKIHAWMKRHPAFIGFVFGIIFAQMGWHHQCYAVVKDGVDWVLAEIKPEASLWEKITFRG